MPVKIIEPEPKKMILNLIPHCLRTFFGKLGSLADDDIVIFYQSLDLTTKYLYRQVPFQLTVGY